MIHVTVEKQGDTYRKVTSRGHAHYDDSGLDIVCAAVSALLINTVNSIEVLTRDDLSVDEDQAGDGYLSFTLGRDQSSDTVLLLDSMVLGLQTIMENYGDTYLLLEELEQDTI